MQGTKIKFPDLDEAGTGAGNFDHGSFTLAKDETFKSLKLQKKPKKIPNYMRANASWMGKDTSMDDRDIQEEVLRSMNKRQSSIVNKLPDF